MSEKYTKEEKLTIAKQLISSSYWEWLSEEYEKQAKLLEPNISHKTDEFTQGVVAGIKWCMNFPIKAEREYQTFFNRIKTKIYGDKEND